MRCTLLLRALILPLPVLLGPMAASPAKAEDPAVGCDIPRRVALQRDQFGWMLYTAAQTMEPTLTRGTAFRAEPVDGRRLLRRGDVVVFCTSRKRATVHLSRVIAIAGDRIRIEGKRVVLNGSELSRDPVAIPDAARSFGTTEIDCFREQVDAHSYSICEYRRRGQPDAPEVEVPPGMLFVLGDNRDNSVDSRFAEIGLVPADLVIAIATAKSADGGSADIDE